MADLILAAGQNGTAVQTANTIASGTHGEVKTDNSDNIRAGTNALRIDGGVDVDAGTSFSLGATAATVTLGATATTMTLGGGSTTSTVPGDLVVTGDLTVNGTTTTIDSETVLIADNHLYLNNSYTPAVAQSGGLVVNYLPTATSTTTAGTGVFVAGVDTVSDPTVTTAGAATFAASDIIQISGSANNGENDGIFEVVSHAANLLTIRSTANGVTNQVEDFTQDQFVANAGDIGATITKVNLSVLRAGTDGLWEVASGAVTGLSFTDLGVSGAGNTLDAAYDQGGAGAGRTITVDSGAMVLDKNGTGSQTALEITSDGSGGAIAINVSTVAESSAQIDVDFGATTYTVNPKGIQLDYSAATVNVESATGSLVLFARTAGAGTVYPILISDSKGSFTDPAIAFGDGSSYATLRFSESFGTQSAVFGATSAEDESNGIDVSVFAGFGGAAASGNPAGDGGGARLFGGSGNDATTVAGEAAGTGGAVYMQGGVGGAGAATTNGPAIGGSVYVDGGAGGVGTVGGAASVGGELLMSGGVGGDAGGGQPAAIGGTSTLKGGNGGISDGTDAAGDGSIAYILGGVGGNGSGAIDPGVGGNVSIAGGDGGTSGTGNAMGGSVTVTGGGGQGTGDGGDVEINGGTSGSGTVGSVLIGQSSTLAVDIDAGTGGILMDSTGVVSIDSAATSGNSNLTHNGGAGSDLNVGCTLGSLNLAAGEAAANAISIQAASGGVDIDGALQVNIDSAQAAATAVVINASNASGGIDIDAGTGGIAIDSTGGVSIDAAGASNLTTSSGSMTVEGASSLALSASAASADIAMTPGTAGARGQAIIGDAADTTLNSLVVYDGGGANLAAELVLYDEAGSAWVFWVDVNGKFRIENAATKSGDTNGTVVGNQSV